jgi:uncharacterized protein
MKSSQYNVFIEGSDDHFFVYNTLRGSVVSVDRELKERLETSLGDMDPSVVELLQRHGIVVEDSHDELVQHRLRHNLKKYNTSSSSFLVFTTYSCNLQCPYCYEGAVVNPDYRKTFMNPETTSRVVEFIKNQTLLNRSYTVGIGLYGGEPLLNLGCCETVLDEISAWCKKTGITFYATITTNGTLLTKPVYQRIGKNLSSIHITLDGAQYFHDQKRVRKDGSGSYAEILNNITFLTHTKEHLSIRISVDEENKDSMEEVLDDLEAIGVKGRPHCNIYFAQIIPQDACLTFPTDPEYREMMRESLGYIPPLMKMAVEKGWGPHLAIEIGQEHSLIPMNVTSCDYVKHGSYAVDPGGDIYMCPASAGDTRYCIGTLKSDGVQWNSSYYHILTRDPTLLSPCKECELLPACGGGCVIASYLKHKDYDTAFCNFTRDLIQERIRAHLKFKYPEKIE